MKYGAWMEAFVLPVLTVVMVCVCSIPAFLSSVYGSLLWWLLWVGILPGAILVTERVGNSVRTRLENEENRQKSYCILEKNML